MGEAWEGSSDCVMVDGMEERRREGVLSLEALYIHWSVNEKEAVSKATKMWGVDSNGGLNLVPNLSYAICNFIGSSSCPPRFASAHH